MKTYQVEYKDTDMNAEWFNNTDLLYSHMVESIKNHNHIVVRQFEPKHSYSICTKQIEYIKVFDLENMCHVWHKII